MRRNHHGPLRTPAATDLTRWRLTGEGDRHVWEYIEEGQVPDRPQTFIERNAVGLDTTEDAPPLPRAGTAKEAAYNSMRFYAGLQADDGHWAADYSGQVFLLPAYVIVSYITDAPAPDPHKLEMTRFMRSVQCPDGGWGLHIAGPPTVLGCTLGYICLRILGVPATDSDLLRAMRLIQQLGGPVSVPTWGKVLLSVLNVYSWDGVHSMFPEMWLLPEWLPFHPSKMWCHTRMVYLSMAFLHGKRFTVNEDDFIRSLRKELYSEDYNHIQWKDHRGNVSLADVYVPKTWICNLTYRALDVYEGRCVTSVREAALQTCYNHICADDEATSYTCLSPVSKLLQMLVRWVMEGGQSDAFKRHRDRVRDYLWLGRDGMKFQCYNGSHLWDTALAARAYSEAGGASAGFTACVHKAHAYLRNSQIEDNVQDFRDHYRQESKGGFTFSTRDHSWIVSDTTAEGLVAILVTQGGYTGLTQPVPRHRLCAAVDTLLGMRCADGGFPSYETTRGSPWLELLNPSEIFGNIMVDYTCVECTSSVMQALKLFTDAYPGYRTDEIKMTLQNGLDFITTKQRSDGSWEGTWGVCFTYGGWFALEAFSCMGLTYVGHTAPGAVRRGCDFLVSKQMEDGGWGEDFESCEQGRYVQSERSYFVNTCWALLALMAVRYPVMDVLERGVRSIMSRQLSNGDWPQEGVNGAFAKSGAVNSDSYRNIFPIWTLGRFSKLYPDNPLAQSSEDVCI
ncbi:lanosterol synthase-like [Haliotis rufescens]|uniref:lanosterol synthase-like n=1 Tax=Haliotis rufescens TaxID=6454 RepID=UPI00201E8912|nr:lanosterol synthase-like [Haliotis rufescens]